VENITVVSLFVCSLLGFVFAIFDYNQSDFVLSFSVLFSLIYLGVLTTAFAFIVQNKALNYTSEAAVSFILGTEAIWGIVAAVIVYNEVITINTVISMCLVLFGFYLVSKY
jgi:drug/metabolite transporter (DMT)-like permease